jgi:hypothetical protein
VRQIKEDVTGAGKYENTVGNEKYSIRLFVEVSGKQCLRILRGKLSVSVLDRFGDFL